MRWRKGFHRISKLISVQKLFHFEVRDFGRISDKKNRQIWHFTIFHAKHISTFNFCPNKLKFAPDDYSMYGSKVMEPFLRMLKIDSFMSGFHEKWPEISILRSSCSKHIKWPISQTHFVSKLEILISSRQILHKKECK